MKGLFDIVSTIIVTFVAIAMLVTYVRDRPYSGDCGF